MKYKTALIFGGAGFIGVNLFNKIKSEYDKVFCIDNFSLGRDDFIKDAVQSSNYKVIKADCSDIKITKRIFDDIQKEDCYGDVWHLAANSDIPAGVNNSSIDLKDTFMTTFNITSAMKDSSFDSLYFASSSAIYGDHKTSFLNENTAPLLPISNYGAMKLASEAVISAATESHIKRSILFRFPNVVGTPATHGVIFDFINKLIINPKTLEVLGDGTQKKSYLHVDDLIDGMISVWKKWPDKKNIDIYNIGPKDEGIFVKEIAEIVSKKFGKNVNINYGQSNKGWMGDVPKFFYDTSKITQHTNWKPEMSSEQAICKASDEIYDQLINN